MPDLRYVRETGARVKVRERNRCQTVGPVSVLRCMRGTGAKLLDQCSVNLKVHDRIRCQT